MKKLLAFVLVLAIILSLTACSTSKSNTSATSTGGDTNSQIKIGVSIWSSTDVLGSQCKKMLDAAASALGVQLMYVDQGHVSEKVTASVETLTSMALSISTPPR